MNVDREMAKAIGYLGAGVIAVAAGGFALIAFGSGNIDLLNLFLPVMLGYSVIVAFFAFGLAAYGIVRSRSTRSH
jgi:hypothetical protein